MTLQEFITHLQDLDNRVSPELGSPFSNYSVPVELEPGHFTFMFDGMTQLEVSVSPNGKVIEDNDGGPHEYESIEAWKASWVEEVQDVEE